MRLGLGSGQSHHVLGLQGVTSLRGCQVETDDALGRPTDSEAHLLGMERPLVLSGLGHEVRGQACPATQRRQ